MKIHNENEDMLGLVNRYGAGVPFFQSRGRYAEFDEEEEEEKEVLNKFIDHVKGMNPPSYHQDPLKYFIKTPEFSTLKGPVRRLLDIQAGSASVERLFKKANMILKNEIEWQTCCSS